MGSDVQQLSVLVLAEMLCDIHVQCRTSVKILHIILSVKLELVYHRKAIILRIIEIRAVHVMFRRNEEAVFLIPFVVLSGQVLSRDELSVEHSFASLVLTVGNVDSLQNRIHELTILFIRRNLQSEELCSIGKTVNADG